MDSRTPRRAIRLRLAADGLGYPQRDLLGAFDVTVDGPGLWILEGEPGSGKSSLLRALAGAPAPHLAAPGLRAELDGASLLKMPQRQRVGAIFYGFQEAEDQLVGLDPLGEVAFRLENLGVAPRELERRATAALDRFGIGPLARRDTATLSGGEMRRVTLAAASALEAPLLLLDEPTASLDPEWTAQLAQDVARIARTSLVIAAEHHAPTLMRHARGRLRIDQRTLRIAPPRNAQPMLRANPTTGTNGVGADPARLTYERVVLSQPHADRPLVSDLTLRLGRGLVGVAGPNGSGKTCLLRHSAGLGLLPAAGRVRTQRPLRMVFQRARDGFFRDRLADELAAGTPWAPSDPQIERAAQAWGLRDRLAQDPYRLSGGEAQLAAVANALLADPEVVLLDEPTHGLGSRQMELLVKHLREQARRRLVVVATHDPTLLTSAHLVILLTGRGPWMAGAPARLAEAAARFGYRLGTHVEVPA